MLEPRIPQTELLHAMVQRCMQARDAAELSFIIANDTWQIVPYRQACVFLLDPLGSLALTAVSGLGSLAEDSPHTLWVKRVCHAAAGEFSEGVAQRLTADMLSADLAADWAEWWPPHSVFLPLHDSEGKRQGAVLLTREEPWDDATLSVLNLLGGNWAYFARSFDSRRFSFARFWQKLQATRHKKAIGIAVAVLLLFPVRISALAPAEIIALQAVAIASPMDGVIKEFATPPNTPVKAGTVLFRLDDTTLRNRREVAQKTLEVSRADALAAQQKAFDNQQSKAELSVLSGRVKEKEAELAYLDEALARVEVKSELDGVFIYTDANDWVGKPVVTGERIGQLAQSGELGVLAWLSVGDAINLEAGADMRVYLQVSPLSALSATLLQASYQAAPSPDGIVSYRVRGKLDAGESARVGLRGVAKIYGGWRPLGYWMLRRPLGALRQWLGL